MKTITRRWAAFSLLAGVLSASGVEAQNAPFSWAGWYVTGSAGYGWRATNSYPSDSHYEGLGADFSGGGGYGGSSGAGTPRFNGPAAAFGAGYNYQIRNFVIGAEYEFLYADLQPDPTHTRTSFTSGGGPPFGTGYIVSNYDSVNGDSNRWYGIARLRAGVPVFDSSWVYITVGAAYRLDYANQDPKVTIIPYQGPPTTTVYHGYNKTNAWGVVMGVGFEYALSADLFARAEWLHMDFGSDRYLDPVATALIGSPTYLRFERYSNIARIGLSYRFYSGGY